jgi:hypothetical protein
MSLTYSDIELKQMIDEYIAGIDSEFSYFTICDHIVTRAYQEDKVEREPHVKYTSNAISTRDDYRISRMLWEKIWKQEIFTLFGRNSDVAFYNEDTVFIKV